MKIVGIDLAGNPNNDTGFCFLEIANNKKKVITEVLHYNNEIFEKLFKIKPEIIAIDAPLTYSGENRKCDNILSKYGALPVTLRGMEILALRGTNIAKKLKENNFRVIEIFATASAKILGFYDKDERKMQKNLLNAKISGDIERRFLTKDELDAIFAAITGYLYLTNATEAVGDKNGEIIIPKV